MEVRVESAGEAAMPAGSYVSVRLGEVLKQGKYEPNRPFHFPQMDRRRTARIDVYQHIGSCFVGMDPEGSSRHEVSVASNHPDAAKLRLKVTAESKGEDIARHEREVRTNDVRSQAKDYLAHYCIEERLSEAIKVLLKERPADPIAFICRELQGLVAEPAQQTKPADGSAAKPGARPESRPGRLLPFATYYASHLKCGGPEFMARLYSKFPRKETAKAVEAKELETLREKAAKVFMEACSDGTLARVLDEVMKAPPTPVPFSAPPPGYRGPQMMLNMALCGPIFPSLGISPRMVFI